MKNLIIILSLFLFISCYNSGNRSKCEIGCDETSKSCMSIAIIITENPVTGVKNLQQFEQLSIFCFYISDRCMKSCSEKRLF